MSRKQPKRRAGSMALDVIAGIFILAIVLGVGFSVASADSSDKLAQSGAFGFDEATQVATAATQEKMASKSADSDVARGKSRLTTRSVRTVDASVEVAEQLEKVERKRIAAEKKAREQYEVAENRAALKRVKHQKEMQGVEMVLPEPSKPADKKKQGASADQAREPLLDTYEYGLPAVDWTIGRQAFVDAWTKRIDAYLKDSPLEGYGYAFAEAAWDNGVDPRWSPAISNTESSKGTICFLPCNAWGWGYSVWDDWDSAIRDHVKGLAEVYGYCVTPEAATIYCPPNSVVWYDNTFSEMERI